EQTRREQFRKTKAAFLIWSLVIGVSPFPEITANNSPFLLRIFRDICPHKFYENCFSLFRRPRHLGPALVDQRKIQRGDDRVLRRHRPAGGTQRSRQKSHENR